MNESADLSLSRRTKRVPTDAYRIAALLIASLEDTAELVVALQVERSSGLGKQAGASAWIDVLSAMEDLRLMAKCRGQLI